jgi:hypothetical protein
MADDRDDVDVDIADARRDNQCEHALCSCTVAEDTDYCSAQCSAAGDSDTLTIACECGHAGCAAEIAATS